MRRRRYRPRHARERVRLIRRVSEHSRMKTAILNYLKNLVPAGEPALLRGYVLAALTAILGWLTTHGVLPVDFQASENVKTFLPVVAALIPALVGHLIRPHVSPVVKAVESHLPAGERALVNAALLKLAKDLGLDKLDVNVPQEPLTAVWRDGSGAPVIGTLAGPPTDSDG